VGAGPRLIVARVACTLAGACEDAAVSTSTGSSRAVCAICKKRFRSTDTKTTASTGSVVHDRCLSRAKKAGLGKQGPERRQPSKPKNTPSKPNGTDTAGIPARFPGTCAVCDRGYAEGTRIRKTPDGKWGHAACAAPRSAFARNKAMIEAGETFRSQKPSNWRRGEGPSSHPTSR
jgi:hypothetical protein